LRSAEPAPPSAFFLAQAARIERAAKCGLVLDLACGRGRHCRVTAACGHRTVGIDRDRDLLAELRRHSVAHHLPLEVVRADLEDDRKLPFKSEAFGVILVFRFLYRPLAPQIVEALRPGGLLLYETFTLEQQHLPSGPNNPAFLLAPGELPALFPQLEVLESSEGTRRGEPELALAQLAARKPV
jgi:SAM-dependent methyltransferase